MNPGAPKHNQELEFMAKCQIIVNNKCLSFQSSINQMDPRLFNPILKAYSEKLIFLGEIKAEKYLQETLISLSAKLKKQKISEGLVMSNEKKCEQKQSRLEMIFVRKESEKEYDQEIVSRWKEARSNFFKHTIQQKLSQSQIPLSHQTEITKIFMEEKQNEFGFLNINLNQIGALCKYEQQIEELTESLNLINSQFSRRQKETPAITQIIQLKLTELRIISIQYGRKIFSDYRYLVSAFELFKIVHENKSLSSMSLKGVQVLYFKQFIRAMKKSRLNQIKYNQQQWNWMKEFKPSKLLKIVIDPKDIYFLINKEKEVCALNDLAQFGEMFQQLSVISFKINLKRLHRLGMMGTLQPIFQQLAKMRKIKIRLKVNGQDDPCESFSPILQMASSFTIIDQLQFQYIKLSPQFSISRLLAMDQILNAIFEKNTVTRLKLYRCQNFPILPIIDTLQNIDLQSTTFRRQFSFMTELTQSCPSLRSITYSLIKQEWRIEDQLFNQLQQLQISYCQNVSVGLLTNSPSNIKSLTLQASNISLVLFPKLFHITQLFLFQISFDHQLICTIPSPYLVVLDIYDNYLITNKDLEVIDKRWPKLRQLTLQRCPNLNESGWWSTCEFKGLLWLSINSEIPALGLQIQQYLRGRGIIVYQ